jgi:hypothetical protein
MNYQRLRIRRSLCVLRTAVVAVLLLNHHFGEAVGQGAEPQGTTADESMLRENILDRPISELTINIKPPAGPARGEGREEFPIVNRAAEYFQTLEAHDNSIEKSLSLQPHAFCWAAPGFYHQPLYFEQFNIERYGHHVQCGACSDCAQSAICTAHFFATVPLLPYKIGADPCCERQYTLGHYRPGSCNPHQLHFVRPSRDGLTCEAIAITGLIFLVP